MRAASDAWAHHWSAGAKRIRYSQVMQCLRIAELKSRRERILLRNIAVGMSRREVARVHALASLRSERWRMQYSQAASGALPRGRVRCSERPGSRAHVAENPPNDPGTT